jgi:type I restriction enzyme, R subunit
MPLSPSTSEDFLSQQPALELLRKLGWTYLSPDEALALRGGRQKEVLLRQVLRRRDRGRRAGPAGDPRRRLGAH